MLRFFIILYDIQGYIKICKAYKKELIRKERNNLYRDKQINKKQIIKIRKG